VWFDNSGKRLAQTNLGLARVDPHPNLTSIGLYLDLNGPTEIDLTADPTSPGGFQCQTEALPPSYCRNGSRTCPPEFGSFGHMFTPFTDILGDYYLNTSFLAKTDGAELWQSIKPPF